MNRLFWVAGFVALAVGVPLLAFWYGFRQGAEVALMIEAVPRGGLSLFQLQKRQEGSSTNMTFLLESDVDIALMAAHQLDHHPLLPVLEPLSGLLLPRADSLVRLADYRKNHPSPLGVQTLAKEPIAAFNEAAASHATMLEAARENETVILLMVKKYASPK